jgi:hypothetical protein
MPETIVIVLSGCCLLMVIKQGRSLEKQSAFRRMRVRKAGINTIQYRHGFSQQILEMKIRHSKENSVNEITFGLTLARRF